MGQDRDFWCISTLKCNYDFLKDIFDILMEVDNDEKDIFDQEFPYWDAHMILNGTYGASSIPLYYSIP